MSRPKALISPIKLNDNMRYQSGDFEETRYVKSLKFLNTTDKRIIALLKDLSANTIQELNNNPDGGIWVWPYTVTDSSDDLKKMKVLECAENNKEISSITTNNLVGFVGKGDTQIEINSRFSCSGNSEQQEQDYFLYYMLSKVFHLNIVNMDVGSGSLKELDLLIFMFPRLLQDAMRQGLYKQYVKREYNDSNIRGTIDVNRHLRLNYPPNGRIAYRTREFSYDNYVTQLIRHTIEHVARHPMGAALLSESKEMEECVRNIVQNTPSYQKSAKRTVMADNRKVVSHPYFTKYKALQQLCLAILRNERISHGTQSDKVHGVLIDVAWLWEEYLAIVLSEVEFKHHTSQNSFKLFKNVDSERCFQTVIPDYLHTNNYVADAKYIPLHRFEHLDAERAAAVYYKTIMYMYRFATPKGFLFHPCHADDRQQDETLEGDNAIIRADYIIDNSRECTLYKLGMVIPSASKFTEFTEEMSRVESAYTAEIDNCCKKALLKN